MSDEWHDRQPPAALSLLCLISPRRSIQRFVDIWTFLPLAQSSIINGLNHKIASSILKLDSLQIG
jgi:hypothetical protein